MELEETINIAVFFLHETQENPNIINDNVLYSYCLMKCQELFSCWKNGKARNLLGLTSHSLDKLGYINLK